MQSTIPGTSTPHVRQQLQVPPDGVRVPPDAARRLRGGAPVPNLVHAPPHCPFGASAGQPEPGGGAGRIAERHADGHADGH